MAKIFEQHWKGGKHIVLPPGYHYWQEIRKKIGSIRTLIVPENQVVTIYKNQDRKGNKSLPFHAGEYLDMDFYQNHIVGQSRSLSERGQHNIGGRHPGLIHVEQTPLKLTDLLTIWWKADMNFKKTMKVGIGDNEALKHFLNDKIDHFEIPFGMTIEAYEHGPTRGGSLIFSGTHQGELTHIDLHEYGYNDKVSYIKVRSDEWEPAGIALTNPEIIEKSDEVRAGYMRLDLNNEQITAGTGQVIGGYCQDEVGEEWGIGGSVATHLNITAGYEAAGAKVETEAGVEVEIHADYGKSKTTATEKHWEATLDVSRETVGTIEASLIVERGEMRFDAERKFRNKTTGAIITDVGKVTYKHGVSARAEVH